MVAKFLKSAGIAALTAVLATTMSSGDADAQKVRWKLHQAYGQNQCTH